MMGKEGLPLFPLSGIRVVPKKVRKLDIRVNVDLASRPGPPGFLGGPWMQVHGGCITGLDFAAWPYSVGILCKCTSFLGTLHWPTGSVDMGHFGVSFSELLILFEQWVGHRLLSEKVTGPHVRANRPILIPSAPVSEGVENRQGCQFVSTLVRPFSKLPGGPHVKTSSFGTPGSLGFSEPTPEEPLRGRGAQGGSGSSPLHWIPKSGVQG